MSEDYVAILLRQIGNALPGEAGRRPDEISELSFGQVHLLGALFELERTGREPPSLSALSQETGFSKAAVCATLKKLRKAGFVQMRTDDADNRRKRIALTQQAREAKSSAAQYVRALDRTLCAGLSPEELRSLTRSLRVILQNARKSGSDAPG